MNQEYRSKVDDAFKMVLERIEESGNANSTLKEKEFLFYMEKSMADLSDSHKKGSMKGQKFDAREIASTAILYIVKFL